MAGEMSQLEQTRAVLQRALLEADRNPLSTHALDCRHVRKGGRPDECDCWVREARELLPEPRGGSLEKAFKQVVIVAAVFWACRWGVRERQRIEREIEELREWL
jgi:hypothetical protein